MVHSCLHLLVIVYSAQLSPPIRTILSVTDRQLAIKKPFAFTGRITTSSRDGNPTRDPAKRLATTSQPDRKQKPLILLYHKLHGSATWWFTMTDKDFQSCPYKCQVTNNKTLYKQSDMVMFEAMRFINKRKGDQIYLEYFRYVLTPAAVGQGLKAPTITADNYIFDRCYAIMHYGSPICS